MVIGLLVVDVVVVVVRKIGVVSAEHLSAEINEDLVDVGWQLRLALDVRCS